MVVAKSDRAHAAMVIDFFQRRVVKEYTALSSGMPKPANNAAGGGGDGGGGGDDADGETVSDSGGAGGGGGGGDGLSGSVRDPLDGLPARSDWRLLECFGGSVDGPNEVGAEVGVGAPDASASASLFSVRTFTGRKHQVRRHLANGLGCPIFLDPLYAPKVQYSRVTEI